MGELWPLRCVLPLGAENITHPINFFGEKFTLQQFL